jgi:hypothetical protein
MVIDIIFRWQSLAVFLSLLFVFAVATQTSAKDSRAEKGSAAPAVTGSSYTERGIIIVGGKGEGSGNPSGPGYPHKGKAPPQDPYKSRVLTPGSDVSLNPQPLPPKAQQMR